MRLSGSRSTETRLKICLIAAMISFSYCGDAFAQKSNNAKKFLQLLKEKSTMHADLEYARIGNRSLKLNLAVPKDASKPTPLVIWIHGGGWMSGSKNAPSPAAALLLLGYSAASIEYRFLDDAPFPAQIHDSKAAIRWLRANADKYNIDPNRFAVWGASAGGQLASLLGTSGDIQELEGSVGDHVGTSSRVQAVCSYFGPTDLSFWLREGGAGRSMPGKLAEVPSKMFKGSESAQQAMAELCSPISHVSRDDPPVLQVHGDKDPIVPIEQSRRFTSHLKEAGVKTQLIVLPGESHGGKEFFNPNLLRRVATFFDSAW